MGDTGASGVVGAIYIFVMIALIPILIGALLLTRRSSASERKKQDRVGALRLVLCIILIPVLIFVGYVGYEVAKVQIEAKWRQQDDELRIKNAAKPKP